MRVLIVNPRFFVYGGAELLIVELCRHLASQNVEHALLTTAIISEVTDKIPNTRIILVSSNWDSVKYYFDLWSAVRKYSTEFEVVNLHNFPAEFSAFICPRPVVWMCNEPELYLRKIRAKSWRGKLLAPPVFQLERWIIRNFISKSIVSDSFNARRFESLYNIVPNVINYGIDYDFFSNFDGSAVHQLKTKWGNRFVILHVGMMTPLKNQLRSLQVLREAKKRISNCLLILAGSWEDSYKTLLDSFIAENKLGDHVLFTGHIDRQELKNYYYACNVLLHPIGAQGGWLAPFEALCAALPIIVAPELTASEIIAENKIGTVTEDYVGIIEDMQEHHSFYLAMAQTGKQWVKENLSWYKFCQGMLDVFNAALTDNNDPARH